MCLIAWTKKVNLHTILHVIYTSRHKHDGHSTLLGNILPADQIQSNLRHVMEDNSPPPTHPLGYLTSENRDTWAAARDNLLASGMFLINYVSGAPVGYLFHRFWLYYQVTESS